MMQRGATKVATAAAVALVMLLIISAPFDHGVVLAARPPPAEGGGGHGYRTEATMESIPAMVSEGKGGAKRSNCTQNPNNPSFGSCPP